MTDLERLALAVSARLSGDDLVLVLDYAAALERSVRADALRDALATVIRMSPDTGPEPTLMETELRAMIERECAHD